MFNRTMLLEQLRQEGSFYKKVKKYFDRKESNALISDFGESNDAISLEEGSLGRKSNVEKQRNSANKKIAAINQERNILGMWFF